MKFTLEKYYEHSFVILLPSFVVNYQQGIRIEIAFLYWGFIFDFGKEGKK